MVIYHSPDSPLFDFSSIFPPNNDASVAPHSLQQNCAISLNFNLPNPKLDDSPAFSGDLHSRFGSDESSEDSPRREGSPGLGYSSGSTLEEAPQSNNGRELGGTRCAGERGMNRSGHAMYKGVRKRKGGKWVSEIREPGKKTRIWLGTFSTPEMAASAYDVAAFNLKTPFAYLNFPQDVSSLPTPPSRSPKHIQAAAAIAASRGVASHMGRTGGLVATPTPRVHETATSSSAEGQVPQCSIVETKASLLMMDEDMIFDMPNVLAHMAEGLMIAPPLHYLAKATNACDRNAGCALWNL